MARRPALPDWIHQARRQRVMTPEDLAELFGVTAAEVKAWEAGTPVPDALLFAITRWLETGYLPDGPERLAAPDGYPWVTDPRA